MRRVLALLTAFVLAGCATRERTNPFDPANGETGGRPLNFNAFAGDQYVDLTWQRVTGENLEGYQIFRRAPGETGFRPLTDVLPLTTGSYRDVGLLNDADHTYRLYYVVGGSLSSLPAEDTATPGTLAAWVIDVARTSLDRASPDLRDSRVHIAGLLGPSAVASDTSQGLVWVSDRGTGSVYIHRASTRVTTAIPGFAGPSAIAVSDDSTAWVCDELGGRAFHFRSNGSLVGVPIEPLVAPIGIAVDITDHSVWICDRGNNRVARYSAGSTLMWAVTLDRPSRVVIDPTTRAGWVTSFSNGRVYRIGTGGAVEQTISSFTGPIGIAFDPRRDRVWVADALAGQLVALDGDGVIAFRLGGLTEVRDVAVDLDTGDAYAVSPTLGEIVRVSFGGTILRRLGGSLISPFGIALDRDRSF